ncbi:MAG: tRNA 2-thiocytidine biosynthesis TtcA family protein [Lachnospiraceae bacterium]
MHLQKLYRYTRQAVQAYNLIQEGDCIGIGISGGKDSLTLLYALAGLRRFYPIPFELKAFTIDQGFGTIHVDDIKILCHQLEVPYFVVPTQIGAIVASHEKESPCSICARLRRGALYDALRAHGCNKAAYGHHRDDVIETAMMSLIFEGRFYAFAPWTKLGESGMQLIRPLIYVSEGEIRAFQKNYQLPVMKNPCPYDGQTKRTEIKQLITQLSQTYPDLRRRIFHAVEQGDIGDWRWAKMPHDERMKLDGKINHFSPF